ncbi:MAG: ABC transporter ATP-binding protein, partial [Candidatus Moranbacteria bacterium GW2011_GWF1_34_10]
SVSIHANRDILLMDEVLAVGDSNFQSKCLEEFNKYRDMGRTVIIVTHDILVVQRYCDRAMLLRDGKIVKIGSADDVGDIYISQNISDNAKKMQDDDSLDKEDGKRRHKNNVIQCGAIRKVMFEKIELLDSNEKKLSLVKYDQPVILRLVIVANDNVKNLAFGYHIRDSSGLDIVYSDNIIENFKFTNLKKGQQYIIDWKFKMSLIQGSYKIACALSIPIDLKKSIVDMCDFVGSAVNFQVYPREGSFLYGKVHLDNNINIINHENIN